VYLIKLQNAIQLIRNMRQQRRVIFLYACSSDINDSVD